MIVYLLMLLFQSPSGVIYDPLYWDLCPFPPKIVVDTYATAAREHCLWLKDNAALNSDRLWYDDYYREAIYARSCWSSLAEASNRSRTEEERWTYLEWLELLLGDEAYAHGWMPCPLPCWWWSSD